MLSSIKIMSFEDVWWIMHQIKSESFELVIGLSINGVADGQRNCQSSGGDHSELLSVSHLPFIGLKIRQISSSTSGIYVNYLHTKWD